MVCFKCGEEGHQSFECPNYNMQEPKQREQPRLNLAQAENEEGDEFEVFPDIGENLMIQRAMMIPEKEQMWSSNNEYSWLLKKKFRTRCTSGGKVCKVIIDSMVCYDVILMDACHLL